MRFLAAGRKFAWSRKAMDDYRQYVAELTRDAILYNRPISIAIEQLRNAVLNDHDVHQLVKTIYDKCTDVPYFTNVGITLCYNLMKRRTMLQRFQRAMFEKIEEELKKTYEYLNGDEKSVRRATKLTDFLAGMLGKIYDEDDEQEDISSCLIATYVEAATMIISHPTNVNIESILRTLDDINRPLARNVSRAR